MTDAELSPRELFSLKDRVAIVTGGGQGLGKTVARGLAEFGAVVAIADINAEQAHRTALDLEAHGHRAVGISCDVALEADVDRLVRQVIDLFGGIDILINNAGISRRYPVAEFPIESWRHVLDVNLIGVFLCARAVGQHMVQRQKGSIVNIASIAGFVGRSTSNTAYAASKAGVINLTRSLGVNWAVTGVRVNAIAPAEIDSTLLDDLRHEPGALAERVARIPMGRIGQPGELIGPTVFLASDASSFVTGHTLLVDGGALAY